jgi:hypothetical protein
MSFPHLEENNLEKLEIFRFLVEIQEKKTANFLENQQVQLPDKIIKTPAYYTILGLWKLNEVPLETYLMWKMYLMNMRKNLKG